MTTVDERYFKNFTKRLYKFLNEGHLWRFEKLKTDRGQIVWNPDNPDDVVTIVIDHREHVISTLIHEVLHHLHPDWNEQKVLKMEDIIIKNLSQRQIKNILKRWAEVL